MKRLIRGVDVSPPNFDETVAGAPDLRDFHMIAFLFGLFDGSDGVFILCRFVDHIELCRQVAPSVAGEEVYIFLGWIAILKQKIQQTVFVAIQLYYLNDGAVIELLAGQWFGLLGLF